MHRTHHCQEGIALGDDPACPLHRKPAPPQAQRNEPHAKAEQGRKHGQAAVVDKEGTEDDGRLIPRAAINDAAEIAARPVGGDDPCRGHIGHGDA